LLEKTRLCNKQALTDIDFKRPDKAYMEWLQGESILRLVAKHREFPYLPPHKKDKYIAFRKVRDIVPIIKAM
jgi:hypothetical protein